MQSWLYQQNPLLIVAALLTATAISAELGFHLGHRWHSRFDDARRAHFGSILGSLLGLLALLLSFTFAMSANRYDARRQLVINDANTHDAPFARLSTWCWIWAGRMKGSLTLARARCCISNRP